MKRTGWLVVACLSGCALTQASTGNRALILQPKINPGAVTQTVINPYTAADIHHLSLKLYTVNGGESYTGVSRTISHADLGSAIAITALKPNTAYRIKAFAYTSTDDTVLISTSDVNSNTDVTLTNDDRPTITPLNVKLINRPFSGQVTDPLNIITGGFDPVSTPKMTSPLWVNTVAGRPGIAGAADGAGTTALFNTLLDIAVDAAGNVYVGDYGNHAIRKILPGGLVSTLAGALGTAGTSNGTGPSARFNQPNGMVVDAAGNVFVAEVLNHTIRKITPGGVVTTLAGLPGVSGALDGSGTAARFNNPVDITMDGAGNLYVADATNAAVRKVTSAGVVTTLAGSLGATGAVNGTGSAARFVHPWGITIDSSGNLYVSDSWNHTIRKVTSTGVVTTFAGSFGATGSIDGTGTNARLYEPCGMAFDSSSNLVFADRSNHTIRKISSSGVVTTIAGLPGAPGYADGQASAACFRAPSGVAIDGVGNIYIGDWQNQCIRIIH